MPLTSSETVLRTPSTARRCFICAYAAAPCARAELGGQIVALVPEVQGATLRLRTGDGGEAELVLRPPWQRLVGDLERHGLALGAEERPIALAAYHLQADPTEPGRWLAGREALVVLEPEWLEDVTSLTRTQYCERHYLIGKFRADPANEATVRGTLAHATFRQIVASPWDNELMLRALDQALRDNAVALAALDLDPDQAREAVVPALRQLVRWARAQAPRGQARSETFLIAHRLGMRGRIDAAWEHAGRIETLAELKTGSTWNGRARVEHELQVGAYGLMLAERGDADLRRERLLLLYAGNPDRDGDPDLERKVPFRIQTFANLVHFRNRLVLIDLTGRATYQGPNRCGPCRLKLDCHRLTELLEAPRCAEGCVLGADCDGRPAFEETDRTFFRRWASLLDREWRALSDATARLWRTAPAARCADGSAAGIVEAVAEGTTPDGGWLYRLRLANDCELRQAERVLLSDAGGPAGGSVAQVELLEAAERELLVLASEPLRFVPRWVDQYGSDRLFLRAYAGLYAWLAEPPERRALVTLLRPPRFEPTDAPPRAGLTGGRELNERQREALELAPRAADYTLIQGPPGTGKTEVIAALARQLTDEGRRVLLLAGTNRALDRLLEACARLGLEERLVRLGARTEPGSVAERRLLGRLAAGAERGSEGAGEREPNDSPAAPGDVARRARELLAGSPIVAATIASLASGPYAGLRGQFDTLVIDEASQVMLPATLGVLGFARRFVLVGDHRQLPPVVQSAADEADPAPGLAESLFEHLARARAADRQPGLICLEEQYRMNAEICAFPSRAWYDGKLRAAASVAGARLRVGEWESGRPPSLPLSHSVLDPARPVVFVDVPGSEGNAPRSNRREAGLARLILEAARQGGVPARELAVIAPFRAQVALIRAELARSADPDLRALAHELVDTVDRFQGSERSAVVYSFATTGPELHPLLLDERRLNVALTRARHKLIVLGDLRALRAVPRFADLEAYCRGLYPDGSGVVEWAAG